jgi:hypothetical protein
MTDRFEHDNRFDKLDALSNWKLVNEDQDLRGRDLYDPHGAKIGTIDDMLVDTEAERVLAFRLKDGRAGAVERLELLPDRAIYHPATPAGAATHYSVRR